MNALEHINDYIQNREKDLDEMRKIVRVYNQELAQIEHEPQMWFGSTKVDFNYLSHQQILEVIKIFGGKWSKAPSGCEGGLDYTFKGKEGIVFRCYGGEPPPNCKVVEEVVTIPARVVPERKEVVRRVVCQTKEQTEEPNAIANSVDEAVS